MKKTVTGSQNSTQEAIDSHEQNTGFSGIIRNIIVAEGADDISEQKTCFTNIRSVIVAKEKIDVHEQNPRLPGFMSIDSRDFMDPHDRCLAIAPSKEISCSRSEIPSAENKTGIMPSCKRSPRMTIPRRMTVLCRKAKVLLEAAGYDVVIVAELPVQQQVHANLIAFLGNADVRYIQIKIAIKPFVSLADVKTYCANEIREIRKQLARHQTTRFHGEIWIATADGRFQCYEVFSDAIREIYPGTHAPVVLLGGAAA